jgi:hypothetical protein
METEPIQRRPGLILRLLLVAGAAFLALLIAASVVFRDDIYQSLLDPGIPFQTYTPPPAPDYARAEAWAARPASPDPDAPAVFFIHNTTYDGGAHWNAPFDRPQEAEEVAQIVIPNFAAPFLSRSAQLYAPRYRQASLYTFMNNREDAVSARLLASQDTQAAFEAFVATSDPVQPIIIVGIGQGALHALKILIDQVAPNEALRQRLAAAYLLEAPVPTDLFGSALSTLQPCRDPDEVRCVISYNTARQDERERIFALSERSMSWTAFGALSFVTDRALLCVNPLLWNTTEDFAPARLHRGGAAAEGLMPEDSPSAMANQTGAQCQNGVLMIERPRANALRRAGRLGEDRRAPDFNLFYRDLQLDAQRRLETLDAIRTEEARYAPPLGEPIEVNEAEVVPIDPPRN